MQCKCLSATIIVDDQFKDPQHNIKVRTQLLREPTLEEVAVYLKEIKPEKVVVISGGRISEAAGITDFRSPDVGLYHAPYENECYYCDVFNKDYFMNDPSPLYKITSFIIDQYFEPTFSHYFIALLEHQNLLLRNYTFNMDDLEKVAGVTKLIQIYGSFYSFVCTDCGQEYSLEWIIPRLTWKRMPICKKCSSLIKPKILLYGEKLPSKIYETFVKDMRQCEMLIVLGSTLSSEPLASVLREVDFKFPRLYINDVDPYNFSDFHFYCEHEHSDVIRMGDCDITCKNLVSLLKWDKLLEDITKTSCLAQGT